MLKHKGLKILLIASLILNLGLAVIFLGGQKLKSSEDKRFSYLSKRIFAQNQNDILINFIPLRTILREYVTSLEGKIGVYFEYLPSGNSIGVNDEEEIKMTSFSKPPLAMAIFKKIERGGLSLQSKVTLEKHHLDKYFGNLWEKGAGFEISIEDLIKKSLVESDNTAYRALYDQVTAGEINEVYDNLDIETNRVDGYVVISPKNYSSIFRSLYLSSFLSKENSNYILELLTQTPFEDKIVASIPKSVPVAHKIGTFMKAGSEESLLSDCGIVYIPSRPYILCVFAQTENEEAKIHMSTISKIIYEYLTNI